MMDRLDKAAAKEGEAIRRALRPQLPRTGKGRPLRPERPPAAWFWLKPARDVAPGREASRSDDSEAA